MSGQTKCITVLDPETLALVWYVLVDDAYQRLEQREGKWRTRGPAPQFSDSEVIVVGMLCDACFGGKEVQGLHWIRHYLHKAFPKLPSNGHFNERRTKLGLICERVREEIIRTQQLFDPEDPYRIIDSAPIPLCTYQRGGECQSFEPGFAIRDFAGHSNKDNAKFMGYRLVATVSTGQVIDQWMLAPAGVHDSVTMGAMLTESHDSVLLGDGAYHHPYYEELAARKRNTFVLAPPRKNSRTAKWSSKYRAFFSKIRRNVEAVFGTLATTFHINHPGSRSLKGFVCRTSSQILAYTLCLVTNQLMRSDFII